MPHIFSWKGAGTLALLLLVLTPTALAQISGYSTTISVTDQNKHTAPTDKDITFVHYDFTYGGNAPNPAAALDGDKVATAWILLNVNHQYHNGQTFIIDATDENEIVYKVLYNGMTIEYRTHLFVEDSGWNLKKLVTSGGEGRGRVVVEYKVYNETGVLVADEVDEEIIGTLRFGSIPDSRLWIQYENRTLTITPDFTAHGILPRYFQPNPPDSPGRVQIFNTTYQSLSLELIATKTVQDIKVAYGFGKPGATPGYTFGSLVSDAATTIGGLLGNVLGAVLDFVFKFLPQGDKLLAIKEYVVLIIDVMWEIVVQEPMLLARVIIIFALGYGLLLWIDPMFKWLFMPIAYLAKGIWKMLVFLWELFLKIVSLVSSKIPGG
ncbi:MAG: hypothetical protein WDA16_07775 [Candidatus Thermoplasmatota archaeon]